MKRTWKTRVVMAADLYIFNHNQDVFEDDLY